MYKKDIHIHFVGIGGIGMSGIAAILKQKGYRVSGCDPDHTQDTISQLQALGCALFEGNNAPECDDNSINILVYIPMYKHTIPSISAEIKNAEKKGIITVTRAQMLAELMREKYSIAVTGSHGKTTTSALISHILLESQYDPTVVIGGNIKTIKSNAHLGQGKFFVAEADESDRSFLQLNPTLNVITNIDIEHLETYADLTDIENTYKQFMQNIPFYGKTVACIDDNNTRNLITNNGVNALTYGIEHPAFISARDIQLDAVKSTFSVYKNNSSLLGTITLPIAGIYNVYNALAAITTALELGVSFDTIAHSLTSFEGVDRRFSYHGTCNGADIFDDYGHHPKEIESVLKVARKKAKNRLIVVFQPHRYTRTKMLWNDFISALNDTIDMLIITDIYSAGEAAIEDITTQKLVSELKNHHPALNVHYIPSQKDFNNIILYLQEYARQDDLILLLGAGKMHLLAPFLKNNSKTTPQL